MPADEGSERLQEVAQAVEELTPESESPKS
jgi:hypothetical protein